MSLLSNFSANLRTTRQKKKMSQEALAEAAHLSLSYVSSLERGIRSPPLETIEQLAGGLKVAPLTLLTNPTP